MFFLCLGHKAAEKCPHYLIFNVQSMITYTAKKSEKHIGVNVES